MVAPPLELIQNPSVILHQIVTTENLIFLNELKSNVSGVTNLGE